MAENMRQSLALTAGQLLEAAGELLERMRSGGEVSVREIKELTAVMKELFHLESELTEGEKTGNIRVVFEGEAEEWSK